MAFWYVTVLVFLLFAVYAQDPKVTITHTDPEISYGKTIIAERGKDVTFSCFVENLVPGKYVSVDIDNH